MDEVDDLGEPLALGHPPRRVVSLVPSLTEAVALVAPALLVGATDYCTHPADLDLPRVGGTKWPTVPAVLELAPDLVLANAEENRAEDVAALRAAGIAVWVTYPRTLDASFDSLARMYRALSVDRPPWLDEAIELWSAPPDRPVRRAVIPVWRRPWIVVGPDTFAGDVLAHLAVSNVYGDGDPAERYPRPGLDEIRSRRPDLVVLPDEPYPFSATDGPEAFAPVPSALLSGRHLTWYGPSLVEARSLLEGQLG